MAGSNGQPCQPVERGPRPGLLVAVLLLFVPGLFSLRPAARPAHENIELRLDPNDAPVHELALLPGLGPGLSREIVEFRENTLVEPAFQRAEDLLSVRGIGPTRLVALRPYLILAPVASEAGSSPEPREDAP